MILLAFLRGVVIGFAIAAPIGPVGVICIRRALADGRLAAFVAGLGAAFADTAFGAVAAFGIGAVTDLVAHHVVVVKVVGGLFMLGLGVHSWKGRADNVTALVPAARGPGMISDFASTFVITATNPGTILGVAGVFAALGLSAGPGDTSSGWLVAGVFCGSTLWWMVLSAVASAARSRFTADRMRKINHLSGALLMVFGALALASLLLP